MNIDIRDEHYMDKQDIIEALYNVTDPELGINIIDLGLVYDILINSAEKTIQINMTLSTRSCPMGGLIASHVRLAVDAVKPGYNTAVEFVWEPKWSADNITEQGHIQLDW